MQRVPFTILFFSLLFVTLHAQQTNPILSHGDALRNQILIAPQPTTPNPPEPQRTNTVVALSYYDTTSAPIPWLYPADYGNFIMLYLAQRFTAPGSGGFVDSFQVRIDEVNGGEVRFRFFDSQQVTFPDGRSFLAPNFNVELGDTSVSAGDFLPGQMTMVHVFHPTGGAYHVPKEFFITVEYTVDGTGANNSLKMVTDSKVRTQRLPDSSRSILVFQVGNSAAATIMDSVFRQTQGGPLLYPDLYMKVFLRTTDPQGPFITSTPVLNAQVGVTYSYQVTATGNPPPTYSLIKSPAGMNIIPQSGAILWRPSSTQTGVHTVIVRASNSKGTYDQSFNITVVNGPGAPKITSTPPLTGKVGTPYSYQVVATGTPAPTFSLIKKPSGMSITAGAISWIPNANQIGNDSVIVRATNTDGMDEQAFVIVVTGNLAPPVFTSTPPTEAIADQDFRYVAKASGQPIPRFSLMQGDPLMVIDATTGELKWRPARTHKGTNQVTIRATNSEGFVDQQFTLNVLTSPIITSNAPTTGKVGELYQHKVTSDAFPAASYKLTIPAPGMTIDTTTGDVRWTPADTGRFMVNIRASNKVGFNNQLVYVQVAPSSVGVDPETQPIAFVLEQNFPNPFSGRTVIRYTLFDAHDQITLKIFDALGRVVENIVQKNSAPGMKSFEFDGSKYQAGTYFYQIRSGSNIATRVMHVVK